MPETSPTKIVNPKLSEIPVQPDIDVKLVFECGGGVCASRAVQEAYGKVFDASNKIGGEIGSKIDASSGPPLACSAIVSGDYRTCGIEGSQRTITLEYRIYPPAATKGK